MSAPVVFSSVLALLFVLISTFALVYRSGVVQGAGDLRGAVASEDADQDGVPGAVAAGNERIGMGDRSGSVEPENVVQDDEPGAAGSTEGKTGERRLIWVQAAGRVLVRGALVVLSAAIALVSVPGPDGLVLWQYLLMLVLIFIVLFFVLGKLTPYVKRYLLGRFKVRRAGLPLYGLAIVLSFLPPIFLLVMVGERYYGALAAALVLGGAWVMGWLHDRSRDDLSPARQEKIGSTGNAMLVYGATSLFILELYRLLGDDRSAVLGRARQVVMPWIQ